MVVEDGVNLIDSLEDVRPYETEKMFGWPDWCQGTFGLGLLPLFLLCLAHCALQAPSGRHARNAIKRCK